MALAPMADYVTDAVVTTRLGKLFAAQVARLLRGKRGVNSKRAQVTTPGSFCLLNAKSRYRYRERSFTIWSEV